MSAPASDDARALAMARAVTIARRALVASGIRTVNTFRYTGSARDLSNNTVLVAIIAPPPYDPDHGHDHWVSVTNAVDIVRRSLRDQREVVMTGARMFLEKGERYGVGLRIQLGFREALNRDVPVRQYAPIQGIPRHPGGAVGTAEAIAAEYVRGHVSRIAGQWTFLDRAQFHWVRDATCPMLRTRIVFPANSPDAVDAELFTADAPTVLDSVMDAGIFGIAIGVVVYSVPPPNSAAAAAVPASETVRRFTITFSPTKFKLDA